MRALVFDGPGRPLRLMTLPTPVPSAGQVLLQVHACAICRTDLHLLDGALDHPVLPLVPGHQVVGTIAACGPGVDAECLGQRVGVSWLGGACGACAACRDGRENLCPDARFTGYHLPGGFADYTVAAADFCTPLPDGPTPAELAPLLCAGAIGRRALDLAGAGERLGLYGFGAAAHLLTQLARLEGRRVFAFTRPGDAARQAAARTLGAEWAGGSDQRPPEPLDVAIIFAPAGELVPLALGAVAPGGVVVCAELRMTDLPRLPYELLHGERVLRSVAHVTRKDVERVVTLASHAPLRASITAFSLDHFGDAFAALRAGKISGSAVLVP
ncbi:MAG: alcohol dehydrogenase [Myxococcales bacterium]|nr:alcohol dehydrogenase [Myxococcales bacterium]